ncbi:MAG: carbamate kinase [Pseudomonadota bacterium]
MTKKLVIALGGNALQDSNDISPKAQLQACFKTAKSVVALIKQGYDVSVVHGNGPQVGEMVLISELANKADSKHPILPFDVCSSITQGYIGYHLQNAIKHELTENNITKEVASLVTQIKVDEEDFAFQNPTKPVGSFYTKSEADSLTANAGYVMKEDAGRGYRRVIASPKPIDLVEKNVIKDLIQNGTVTICCGGGGIPVIDRNNVLVGMPAVIDKDLAAAKLAEIIDADMLIILTAVEQVAINFNKPNQKNISKLTISEARKYIEEGHFAPGSMLPKIEASLSFLKNKPTGKVLITSLEKASLALEGKTGTFICQ